MRIIIGIAHGDYAIKTAHTCFPRLFGSRNVGSQNITNRTMQIGTQRRILWMVLFTARADVPLLSFTRGRVCWRVQDIDGIRTKEDRFIQDRKC